MSKERSTSYKELFVKNGTTASDRQGIQNIIQLSKGNSAIVNNRDAILQHNRRAEEQIMHDPIYGKYIKYSNSQKQNAEQSGAQGWKKLEFTFHWVLFQVHWVLQFTTEHWISTFLLIFNIFYLL